MLLLEARRFGQPLSHSLRGEGGSGGAGSCWALLRGFESGQLLNVPAQQNSIKTCVCSNWTFPRWKESRLGAQSPASLPGCSKIFAQSTTPPRRTGATACLIEALIHTNINLEALLRPPAATFVAVLLLVM